jgi:hypothetical protein
MSKKAKMKITLMLVKLIFQIPILVMMVLSLLQIPVVRK